MQSMHARLAPVLSWLMAAIQSQSLESVSSFLIAISQNFPYFASKMFVELHFVRVLSPELHQQLPNRFSLSLKLHCLIQ